MKDIENPNSKKIAHHIFKTGLLSKKVYPKTYITKVTNYTTMPRKSQTQERFRTISIEDSLYQELHRNKLPGEPIYQTAHRMFRKYHQSELEDAEFMINEYQGVMQRQTEKLKVIERYV